MDNLLVMQSEKWKKEIKSWLWFKRFPFAKQVQFVTYLNSWLESYASDTQACLAIMDAYKIDTVEYKVAAHLKSVLGKGKSLGDGMKGWFHPNIVSVFSSAEKSGDRSLKAVLNEFIEFERIKKDVKNKFVEPLRMPMVLSGLLVAASIPAAKLISVVAERQGASFEFSFAMFFTTAISELFTSYLWFSGFVILASVIFLSYYAKTSTTKFRLNFLDKHFPFNIYREFSAMKVLSTIGLLVQEGSMTPKRAAQEIYPEATDYQRYHLERLIRSDNRGEQSLWELFDTGLLNSLSIQRLKILSNVKNESVRRSAIINAARNMKEDTLSKLERVRSLTVLGAWLVFGFLILTNALSMLGALTQF